MAAYRISEKEIENRLESEDIHDEVPGVQLARCCEHSPHFPNKPNQVFVNGVLSMGGIPIFEKGWYECEKCGYAYVARRLESSG